MLCPNLCPLCCRPWCSKLWHHYGPWSYCCKRHWCGVRGNGAHASSSNCQGTGSKWPVPLLLNSSESLPVPPPFCPSRRIYQLLVGCCECCNCGCEGQVGRRELLEDSHVVRCRKSRLLSAIPSCLIVGAASGSTPCTRPRGSLPPKANIWHWRLRWARWNAVFHATHVRELEGRPFQSLTLQGKC